MNENEAAEAQRRYVEARLAGKSRVESRELAGYSAGTNPSQIERPGGPVKTQMEQALRERGLTEGWLAEEYIETLDAAGKIGAKEKDLNAKAQLLKQLGFLMGYGQKPTPTVAVQINNGGGGGADEPGPTRELIAEVAELVKVLESQVGKDQQQRLPAGNTGAIDAQSCERVVESTGEASASSGGGGAGPC